MHFFNSTYLILINLRLTNSRVSFAVEYTKTPLQIEKMNDGYDQSSVWSRNFCTCLEESKTKN